MGRADRRSTCCLAAPARSVRISREAPRWPAAPSVSRSFNVTLLAQTITFTGPTAKTLAQTPVVVAAIASSGLPVTFTTTTAAVCTAGGADGATIDLVAAGTCTVRAVQPGDGTYGAIAVSRSFTVSKVAQTISFPAPPATAPLQPPFTVTATASSGLPVTLTTTTPAVCSVNGTEVTTLTTGTCTIRAEQAGDAYWKAALAVSRNVTVAKAAQTIAFDPISSPMSAHQAFSIGATASSGLRVTFSSTTAPVCTVENFFGAARACAPSATARARSVRPRRVTAHSRRRQRWPAASRSPSRLRAWTTSTRRQVGRCCLPRAGRSTSTEVCPRRSPAGTPSPRQWPGSPSPCPARTGRPWRRSRCPPTQRRPARTTPSP